MLKIMKKICGKNRFKYNLQLKNGDSINFSIKKDLQTIIDKRMIDYNYFYQRLAILGHKGHNYLSLLMYLADIEIKGKDDFY